jgi:MFS family permease
MAFSIQCGALKSLAAGVLIHLCLGSLYLWGNITVAVTSYIRQFEPSVTYNDSILVYAMAIGFQGIFMLIGGISERKFGLKPTILVGGSMLSAGVFLSSFAQSLFAIIVLYGFMFSVGMGMCYAPPIVNCVRWMPERKGLITGIVVAGFGCGAFVFGGLATVLTNPSGLNTDESGYFPSGSSVCNNVPSMFRTLGAVYAVLFTIAAYLIEEPRGAAVSLYSTDPEKNGQVNGYFAASINDIDRSSSRTASTALSGFKEKLEVDVSSTLSNPEIAEIDTRQLITNSLAWQLAICYVMTVAGGMYLAGTYKTYGQIYFKNREIFLSTIGGVASIFNGLGRLAWGYIADSIGVINALSTLAFSFSVIIWLYPLTAMWENEIAFSMFTFCIFFFVGGNFALYLPLTIQLFGSKNASSNYGAIVMVYCTFNALNILFLSRISPPLTTTCVILGFICFLGFVNIRLLSIRINRLKRKSGNTIVSDRGVLL